MRYGVFLLSILGFAAFGGAAFAQAIGPEQRLMLEAAQHVMKRELPAAEAVYSQVISQNPANTDAYLQRGLVRREMGNRSGAQSDGQSAVALAERALAANPNNAELYHQRGTGFRLQGNFTQARQDIDTAMRLGGPSTLRNDRTAIDVEEKTANAINIAH